MSYLQKEKNSYSGSPCFSLSVAICYRALFCGKKRALLGIKSV